MTSAKRLHGQDRASFGAQWPQCGAQTVSAALPQKTHGETPVLYAIMIYHSPTMTWPRPSQFWGTVATMWSTNSECTVAANTHGETPVLCVIMIYHSPTMTSAQRLHGQDRASFGAQWPQCGAPTVSAALPQKTHGDTPVLCVITIYQSPIMTFAQRLHGQDRASFGALCPQCGAQTVSAALPQKTHGETPVLCVIMIYHSPTMTSAQRLHGQDRASFGAQWPQCGAQTVSAALPQKTTWLDPSFVCNNDLPQSNHDFCTKAAWPRPSQFWGTVATIWGTNSECSIAAKNKW